MKKPILNPLYLCAIFIVSTAVITIQPLVFSKKIGHGFCCNYLFDSRDIVKETACSVTKQSGSCWGRQIWASLWLWLRKSKVNSDVPVNTKSYSIVVHTFGWTLRLSRAYFSCLTSLCAYAVLPLCQVFIKRPDSLQSLKFLGWLSKTILVVLFGEGYPDFQYWLLMKLEGTKPNRPLLNLSLFLSFNISLSVEQMMEEIFSLETNKLSSVKEKESPTCSAIFLHLGRSENCNYGEFAEVLGLLLSHKE